MFLGLETCRSRFLTLTCVHFVFWKKVQTNPLLDFSPIFENITMGGYGKVKNWWKYFPIFIPYIKMDTYLYWQISNQKISGASGKVTALLYFCNHYTGLMVTKVNQYCDYTWSLRNFLICYSKVDWLSILIYGIKLEKKFFIQNFFFMYPPTWILALFSEKS